MKALIKIDTRGEERLVSAKELHEKLGIKKDFTDWFKYQAEILGLVEGVHFTPFLGKSQGGRPGQDYVLLLDIAKNICMTSRGKAAQKIRDYFIEVEKKYKVYGTLIQGQEGQVLDLIIATAEEMKGISQKVDSLGKLITIDSGEQRKIQRTISKRAYERLKDLLGEGKEKTASGQAALRKIFPKIHKEIRNKFGVPSYRDVKRQDLESVINIITLFIEDRNTREDILEL